MYLLATLFLSILFSPFELLAQSRDDEGPILKGFLDRITVQGYTPTMERDPDSNSRHPTYRVVVRNEAGEPVLLFDYQSESGSPVIREHIFNAEGSHWPLLEELLEPVFAEELKDGPAARVFLRTIWTSLLRKKLLAMTLATTEHDGGVNSMLASLYLIMDSPGQGSAVHFTSVEEPEPQIGVSEYLPLIVLEFHPQLERSHLHYLRYLIPVKPMHKEGESPLLFGINLKTAHETLNNFRRFAVAVDVQDEVTTIYPSLYDGREIISEVTLEIYALSNYIQGFLDWFVQIWWREFPEGRAIHMKRQIGEKKFLDLSLYRYRAQLCSSVIHRVTRN